MIARPQSFIGVLLAATFLLGCGSSRQNAQSHNARELGVIATVHPLATDAGADVLRRGGNAVDAAVAAALMLGVVDGHNSGIGGGCFVLVRKADGTIIAIDGRETAPAAVKPDTYLGKDGKADPKLSQNGPLASGVPGALAAYDRALRDAGRTPLAELLAPAAERAEQGFAISDAFVRRTRGSAKELAQFEGSAAIFLNDKREPWPAGHVLKQTDLAKTYRAIAKDGIDWFYRGPFARDVETWMAANGGILTAEDFAKYRAVPRAPLVTQYRGHTIVGFPPPSSGGVHIAQALNILESFDLKDLDRRDPVLWRHVTAEALKLAFADRAYWLGDPDFTKVPRGLADKAYAGELAKKISLERATPVKSHGQPPAAGTDVFPAIDKHTTHIAAADAEGNWVAITATVNTGFGSKVVIPGTGVIMNDEMDDFSMQAGVANSFGLVGGEANLPAPGKRPLSSMSPTIVFKGDLKTGQPVLTVGAAGGPHIISATLQIVLNHIDLGLSVDQALAEPRLHHQWEPDVLNIEDDMPAEIVDKLKAMGHQIRIRETIAVAQAAGTDGPGGGLKAAHDPWIQGKAVRVMSDTTLKPASK